MRLLHPNLLNAVLTAPTLDRHLYDFDRRLKRLRDGDRPGNQADRLCSPKQGETCLAHFVGMHGQSRTDKNLIERRSCGPAAANQSLDLDFQIGEVEFRILGYIVE